MSRKRPARSAPPAPPRPEPQPEPQHPDAPAPPSENPTPARPIVAFVSRYLSIRYPTAPGGSVQFAAGRFATDNPETIAFLDERDTCERA